VHAISYQSTASFHNYW